jgi:hypothetical protein
MIDPFGLQGHNWLVSYFDGRRPALNLVSSVVKRGTEQIPNSLALAPSYDLIIYTPLIPSHSYHYKEVRRLVGEKLAQLNDCQDSNEDKK